MSIDRVGPSSTMIVSSQGADVHALRKSRRQFSRFDATTVTTFAFVICAPQCRAQPFCALAKRFLDAMRDRLQATTLQRFFGVNIHIPICAETGHVVDPILPSQLVLDI